MATLKVQPRGPSQSPLAGSMPGLHARSMLFSPSAPRPPFPRPGESLGGLWVQQGCLCQPMELISQAHTACGAAQGQLSPRELQRQELGLKTEEWFASCARQLSLLCKTRSCPVTLVAPIWCFIHFCEGELGGIESVS